MYSFPLLKELYNQRFNKALENWKLKEDKLLTNMKSPNPEFILLQQGNFM